MKLLTSALCDFLASVLESVPLTNQQPEMIYNRTKAVLISKNKLKRFVNISNKNGQLSLQHESFVPLFLSEMFRIGVIRCIFFVQITQNNLPFCRKKPCLICKHQALTPVVLVGFSLIDTFVLRVGATSLPRCVLSRIKASDLKPKHFCADGWQCS